MACLALETIFEEVRDRFALEAPDVSVLFGWKKPGFQLKQGIGRANRIVFVPGDADKAGEYLDARYPGKLSRALRTMLETATIYVWAYDATAPNDELAQWRACRYLLDSTVRAIDLALRKHHGLHDQKVYSGAKWRRPGEERVFGAEVSFVLTLMSTVPDELPNLGGPPRQEVTNTVPNFDVELGKTEAGPWEADPPPLTPADDP